MLSTLGVACFLKKSVFNLFFSFALRWKVKFRSIIRGLICRKPENLVELIMTVSRRACFTQCPVRNPSMAQSDQAGLIFSRNDRAFGQ